MVGLGQLPPDTTVTATNLVMVLLLGFRLYLSAILHVNVDRDIFLSVSVDEDIDVVDVDPHVIGNLVVTDQLVYPLLSS